MHQSNNQQKIKKGKKMKNIYKVMVLIAMSCLSLNAQEKEIKEDEKVKILKEEDMDVFQSTK